MYPPSPEASLALAEQLAAITSNYSGPRIVTDLYIGGVVYTRYGSYSPRMRRDRLGTISSVAPSPDGEYKVPFAAPQGAPNPFTAYQQHEVSEEPISRTIGPGYLLLYPLSIHAKGTVYLSLGLRRQADADLIVLKEARRHCMSDEFGRDMWDRLCHQEHVHRLIAGKMQCRLYRLSLSTVAICTFL